MALNVDGSSIDGNDEHEAKAWSPMLVIPSTSFTLVSSLLLAKLS